MSTPSIDSIRAQISILSTKVNNHPLCYLDGAATSPIPYSVLDEMFEFDTKKRGNVSRSGHYLAGQADQAYQQARERVAAYINATSTDEIVFTSGTTMSINLLANSLGLGLNRGDEIVISLAEHHSNYLPWQMLKQRIGIVVKTIPVTTSGRLNLSTLDELVTDRCKLIAVTHVSNVTGAITDVATINQAARRVGALVMLDGAQAVPHGPVNLSELDVDFYVFSGHKCYGPTGIGVLWGKKSKLECLPPFFSGGGMVQRISRDEMSFAPDYQRFEAGTPPIAQAIGLGAALDWLQKLPWELIRKNQRTLMHSLLCSFDEIEGLKILGPKSTKNRFPIFSFAINNHHAHDVCHLLDQEGIALRGGHHCAQPLMEAFGIIASSRASLSLFNNSEDIERFVNALNSAICKLEE